MKLTLEPLPKEQWRLSIEGGKLIVSAARNVGANSAHHIIAGELTINAADYPVSIHDLEGVEFVVENIDLSSG
ncbi:MAG: hypothetical protein JKY94_11625 [Rhodobacteraceae bacterium]|nr:hypothetical protein [Paracoccaceae bacterium]